eukprot:14584718-Ditylum_brightwellii.AAC.1
MQYCLVFFATQAAQWIDILFKNIFLGEVGPYCLFLGGTDGCLSLRAELGTTEPLVCLCNAVLKYLLLLAKELVMERCLLETLEMIGVHEFW